MAFQHIEQLGIDIADVRTGLECCYDWTSQIRQRRRMLDLTQRALADQVGCAEITVRQMEADALKPSKGLAEILLERLGIPQFERPEWVAFARGTSGYPQKIESHLSQLDQKTN